MRRLLYCIAFTSDIEPMKQFYRDGIGLRIASETPFFVQFENGAEGASMALVAVPRGQSHEVELCFETADIVSAVAALRLRGVEFDDEIRQETFGKVIHFRDSEGSLLSLLEPASMPDAGASSGGGLRRASSSGAAAGGTQTAVATASAPSTAASATALGGAGAVALDAGPRLRVAIVNCRDVTAAKAFYRDRLGLRLTSDYPSWVEFHAGGATALALHPRVDKPARAERHHGNPVTLGFAVEDLMAWADEARARGIHFTTAPIDEDFGLFADAEDPEGYEITFREPAPPPGIEEQLAEAFEDEEAPPYAAIRKSVKKGAKAVSRVAVKPEYKEPEVPKKPVKARPLKKRAVRVHSTRGAGPEGTRLKPKRAADPKRARNRPATGRLKKAERRTLAQKKRAVASASKTKPVKHAASPRAKKR